MFVSSVEDPSVCKRHFIYPNRIVRKIIAIILKFLRKPVTQNFNLLSASLRYSFCHGFMSLFILFAQLTDKLHSFGTVLEPIPGCI